MDKENEKNLQAVNSERTEKIMSQYRKHLMACLARSEEHTSELQSQR